MTSPFRTSHACTLSDEIHSVGDCKPATLIPAFKRAVMVGRKHLWEGAHQKEKIWIEIRWEERNGGWELSICGVEGPRKSGNCAGSCGQCRVCLLGLEEFGTGWDAAMVERLGEIWDAWHLNRMQAGSPAQRAHLDGRTWTGSYPDSHFDWAKRELAAAGLEPDPNYIHKGKPYSYGSAWLSIEVPDEVVTWLRDVPKGTTGEFPWSLH